MVIKFVGCEISGNGVEGVVVHEGFTEPIEFYESLIANNGRAGVVFTTPADIRLAALEAVHEIEEGRYKRADPSLLESALGMVPEDGTVAQVQAALEGTAPMWLPLIEPLLSMPTAGPMAGWCGLVLAAVNTYKTRH